MKKLILALSTLFLSTPTFPHEDSARIYTPNPAYHTLINYQICPLDLQNPTLPSRYCDPIVKNITIKSGTRHLDIKLPNSAFFVKVINAYQLDNNGLTQAYGAFPGEDDCKIFYSRSVTLREDGNIDRRIICD